MAAFVCCSQLRRRRTAAIDPPRPDSPSVQTAAPRPELPTRGIICVVTTRFIANPAPAPQQLAAAATAALLLTMVLHRRRRRPTTPSSTPPQHIRPLPDFATLPRVGWRWERWKTADENWLDLAYLVARASEAKDGHMGCCIVRDPHGREPSLISTTINCGIYGRYRSDLHAEAAAVSDCARRGEKLEGCTLYVTRAPCPRCHCLIAAAGASSPRRTSRRRPASFPQKSSASRWSSCGTRRRGRPGATASRKNIETTTRSSPRADAQEAEEGQDLRQEGQGDAAEAEVSAGRFFSPGRARDDAAARRRPVGGDAGTSGAGCTAGGQPLQGGRSI